MSSGAINAAKLRDKGTVPLSPAWADPFVFLSYRSFEREFAAQLARDLRNAGFRLWMDVLEGGIQGGDNWRDRLQSALDNCAGMISVFSPDYVSSRYCRSEVARVDRRGARIIPVLLESLEDASDTPFGLESLQYLDFRRWRHETDYKARLGDLQSTLRRVFSGVEGSRPDEETQYLNQVIAGLGDKMGVLEYVEFGLELTDPAQRPGPLDEWGYSVLRSDGDASRGQATSYAAVADVAQECPRFVLLGAPGGGKTSALRRLARAAAYERRDNIKTAPLPLILNLAEWSDESTPIDFIRSHWRFRGDVRNALRSGDIAVFLDGLNEMGQRASRARLLREWIESPECPRRLVITCRVGEYEGDLRLGDLPIVSIKELTGLQIRRFAFNYLEDRAPTFLSALGLHGDDMHGADRTVLGLARNPYFLRSLIELFADSTARELPRNSGVLFHRLTQALWKRENRRAPRGLVSLGVLRSRLARLARAQREGGSATHIPLRYAGAKLSKWYERPVRGWVLKRMLRSARNANLIRFEGDGCSFSHEMMLDYFAALSFLDEAGFPKMDEVAQWLSRFRYRHAPLIALSGITADPQLLVERLLEHDVLLAANCLGSGVSVSDELKQEIVRQVRVLVTRPITDWSPRIGAAEALGLIGDSSSETIVLLAKLLQDPNSIVANTAATALGRIGTAAAARELRRTLDDPKTKAFDFTVRDAMASMGETAVPDLIEILQPTRVQWREELEWPRTTSIDALIAIGQSTVPALLKALQTRPGAIRCGCAEALGQMGTLQAVPALLDAFVDEEARSQGQHFHYKSSFETAFKALGENAIASLVPLLQDTNPKRRKAVVLAMGAARTESVIPHLVSALRDVYDDIRTAASWALGDCREAAMPALVGFLADPKRHGAADAAFALGYMFALGTTADDTAIAALTSVLEVGEVRARMQAARALGSVKAPSVLQPLVNALNDPLIGAFAAESLGQLKAEETVAALLRSLQREGDQFNSLRHASAKALEQIGSNKAVEAAKTYWRGVLTDDRNDDEAIKALGRFRDNAAVSLLIEASGAGGKATGDAVDALALIGDALAVPAIIRCLSDTSAAHLHGDVRKKAISALGSFKDQRAVEPLGALLGHQAMTGPFGLEHISELAAAALENIGCTNALRLAGEYWLGVLRGEDSRMRRRAIAALGRVRYEPAVEDLIAALRVVEAPSDDPMEALRAEREPSASEVAALALETIGSTRAVAAAVQFWLAALGSQQKRSRVRAIQTMSRLRRYEVVPQLIALLKDTAHVEGHSVADYAAAVLEEFDVPEARIPLIEYRDR